MKLWQKNYRVDKKVEKFLTEEDVILDNELVSSEVLGSIAHVAMLCEINIITRSEFEKIKKSLLEILELKKNGEFFISDEDEDIHTTVKSYLTRMLEETG